MNGSLYIKQAHFSKAHDHDSKAPLDWYKLTNYIDKILSLPPLAYKNKLPHHEWNKLNLFTFCTVQNDIIGHCPAYWINCVTLFYLIDMQGIVIVSNYDRVPSDSHSCSEDSICSWWQPSCSSEAISSASLIYHLYE